MTDIYALSEMQSGEEELVPEILPLETRLSFSANVKELSSSLSAVLDVVPVKEIIQNTGFVELSVSPDHIRMSATDGARSISRLYDDLLTVHLVGIMLVPGRKLLDILKLAPASTVRVDAVGAEMRIRSGRAMWTISVPTQGYSLPSSASTEDMEFYTLDRKKFLKSLELSLSAVAKSSSRMSLMQADIRFGSLTSCDGARAHKISIDLPKSLATTLPLKFMETAIRELKSYDEEIIEFGSNKQTVAIRVDGNSVMSQKLNFEFPPVDHLILGPALSNEEELEVNVQDLMETVRRVKVNSDPEFSAIVLAIRSVHGSWKLGVSARDRSGNSSQETLDVDFRGTSSAKDVIANHKYLLDFLACIDTPTATLKLGESSKTKQAPIYIKTDTFEGSLMPMQNNIVKL